MTTSFYVLPEEWHSQCLGMVLPAIHCPRYFPISKPSLCILGTDYEFLLGATAASVALGADNDLGRREVGQQQLPAVLPGIGDLRHEHFRAVLVKELERAYEVTSPRHCFPEQQFSLISNFLA
jgi:hypothetical protein